MVPGMHSYTQMNGNKSSCLLRYCDMNSFPCVVFDNECTGKSEGDPVNLTFTTWVENTIGVIDRLTEGPVVLVVVGAEFGTGASRGKLLEPDTVLHTTCPDERGGLWCGQQATG